MTPDGPMSLDLWGEPIHPEKPHTQKPDGYAGIPGRGPLGETCGSCRHIAKNGSYFKCGLCRKNWTHGLGTDITKRTPACQFWTLP